MVLQWHVISLKEKSNPVFPFKPENMNFGMQSDVDSLIGEGNPVIDVDSSNVAF